MPNDAFSTDASGRFGDTPLRETRVRTEQLLDGVLLKAHRDEVELPDGQIVPREWIDHPGAAAVVPLFADGSTALLRQFRYAAGAEFLEVPAGKIDHPGEAPVEVACRELEEEAGLRAGTLHRMGATYPAIGYSNEIIHLFVAEDLERTAPDRERGEFMEVVHPRFAEAMQKVRASRIQDAKTVAALTMAEAFLQTSEAGEKRLR